MRQHGTSSRRQRSRNTTTSNNNGGRRNNQQRTQVYDSNGPDVRIRGTAHQVAEKYLSLAKDATSMGDRIVAENYYQHAEHYIRIINDNNGKFDANRILSAGAQGHDGNNQDDMSDDQYDESAVDDLSLPQSILEPVVNMKKENSQLEKEVVC